MIRIVGGKYRHRLLDFPISNDIRPTRDMVREAIFNALGDITSLEVLDLFAGCGAYAFESLSRGCKHAYLVDNSNYSLSSIKKNARTLDCEKDCSVFALDYETALARFKNEGYVFDLIFIDPPYKMDIYLDTVNFIISNNLLSSKGIIVLESNHEINTDDLYFSNIKKYKYKDNFVTILRK